MPLNITTLRTATVGFKAVFQSAFDGVPASWNRIAMQVNSQTREEEYGWLGEMPSVREWLGDRIIHQLAVDGYRIKNRDFELTVAVDRNDFDDDRLGIYGPMFQDMGEQAAKHPDRLVFELLKAGHQTACFDGQYFFDTDHPVEDPATGAVTTQSNSGGGAGTPWFLLDTSRAIKPIIYQERKSAQFVAMDQLTDEVVFNQKRFRYGYDSRCNVGYGLWQLAYRSQQTLDATNFRAAWAAMTGRKRGNGAALGVRPTLLVVPNSLYWTAMDLVQAERLANGASNTMRNAVEVMASPWLD